MATVQASTDKASTQDIIVSESRFAPFNGWRLVLADVLLIWVAFVVAYYLRYELQLFQPVDEANSAPFSPYLPYASVFTIWILIANQGAGLYQQRRGRTWANELFSIGNTVTNAAVIVMALSFMLRPLVFSRLLIIEASILTILFLSSWRLFLRSIRSRLRRQGVGVERVLIVGAQELGRHVLRTLVARPDLGFKPIGFVDDDAQLGTTDLGRVPAMGSVRQLPDILASHDLHLVIVTLPWEQHRQIVEIVRTCEQHDIAVRTVPDLFQLNLSQTKVEMLGGIPFLGMRRELEFPPTNQLIKRMLDVVLVVLALPVIVPLFALVGLAIRLDSRGPVFFVQERIGLNGKPFNIYKFRTMVKDAEAMWDDVLRDTGEDLRRPKIDNDPRITTVGRLLRRKSLDELPNLINVLKGDMSLVGPRPQVRREVELYNEWHHQRLIVKPGMTGLWQISGRSDIPFDEMCLLDIYYIEHWSLGLDLQILLQTAPRVLSGSGAY